MELLNLFVKSAFAENMVFTFFFGMCSYLAVSKTVKTAVGLGAAVIFVLAVTVPVNYWLETYVLKDGALAWLGDDYKDKQDYTGYDLSIPTHFIDRNHGWSTTKFKTLISKTL